MQVSLRFMTEAGVWEGWDPQRQGQAERGADRVCLPAIESLFIFSIKKIHGPSVTPFPQRIN